MNTVSSMENSKRPYVIQGTLDDYIKELVSENINLAVPWWLMGSYTYYNLDQSLMSDSMFDYLTRLLLENYRSIKHHHKYLVTKARLSVGSGYDIKKYPLITVSAATGLLTKL